MSFTPAPADSRPAHPRAEALRRSLLEAEPEGPQALPIRAARFAESLRPRDPFESWLVEQVAILSLRVDRSGRSARRLRDRAALRAELCWEEDRDRDAEAIGGRIAARPAETVARLRATAAGCDWLIRRWAGLARAADRGPWTADQERLAFDLLGTPAEFRDGVPGRAIDEEGRAIEGGPGGPAELARGQVAGLRPRRDRLKEADEVDRELIAAGQLDEAIPELRRLGRHESALRRRIDWCLEQLRPAPAPEPDPGPEAEPGRPAEAPPVASTVVRRSRPAADPGRPSWAEIGAEVNPAELEEARRQTRAMIAGLGLAGPGRPRA